MAKPDYCYSPRYEKELSKQLTGDANREAGLPFSFPDRIILWEVLRP